MEKSTNTKKNTNTNELATRGWAERLTSLVVALLVILSVTGLWIYLAPFSVAAQIQVILHTVVGLLILGPYAYYQARHFPSCAADTRLAGSRRWPWPCAGSPGRG